ncbi:MULTISPECIES: hypothetical protein [Burkholderia]|uniref:hypothetical protein n=1 Tax=Burkholderia TaxID=32008 RepID=UPI000841743B|nr:MULTISPECIES: hypothetical protein [unclassified Burkholderia]AOK29660.1 hypothetical protein AQ611_09695 [Burkholderia sp. Bp7605]
MTRPILLALAVSTLLAGCIAYPADPGAGVNVSVGWHGDRYWDGRRYWDREEWERGRPQYRERDDPRNRHDDDNRRD